MLVINQKFSLSWLLFLSLFTLLLAGCDTGSLKYFTVSFEANGGVPEPEKQKIQKGGLLVEPEEMAKDGHDFGSWYRDEE